MTRQVVEADNVALVSRGRRRIGFIARAQLGSQLKAFPDMREVSISGKVIDRRLSAVPAGHYELGRCNRRVQP